MKKAIEGTKLAVVVLLIGGIFVYGGMLLAYAFFKYRPEFLTNPAHEAYVFALPICAIGAFAIVCLLEKVAAPSQKPDKFEFEAFGLKFSGPAAPVTLWVVCYLALVTSAHISRL